MSQIGVASTDSRRQARRNRVFDKSLFIATQEYITGPFSDDVFETMFHNVKHHFRDGLQRTKLRRYNFAMSRAAGFLLILLGLATCFLSAREILHPDQLTKYGSYSTGLIGLLLIFAGLAHFKAPHKAFLMSVPLLIALQIQMYSNALFYFNNPRWGYQGLLLIFSVIILTLSYCGYLNRRYARISKVS
jgi:hypothetical protein